MKIVSTDPGITNYGWISLSRDLGNALIVEEAEVVRTAKWTKAQAQGQGPETVKS
jgi:hypothetical protein